MFTLNQIHDIAATVKTGADFPRYAQELKDLGVRFYVTFVADGRTEYFGTEEHVLQDAAKYEPIKIAADGSVDALGEALSAHQNGETDYPTFCKQAADAGVQKWMTQLEKMQVSYMDIRDEVMLTEEIPTVK